jgi:hypothetical protein
MNEYASPLAQGMARAGAETYVLGAFNPGMTRLPNGNLLMMVRVAEALRTPIFDGHVHAIRWDARKAMCSTPGRSNWPTPPIRASSCSTEAAGSHGADLAVLAPAGRAQSRRTGEWSRSITTRRSPRGPLPMLWRRGCADQQGRRALAHDHLLGQPRTAFDHALRVRQRLDWTFDGIVLDHQNKDMLIFEGLIDGSIGRRRGRWAISTSPIRRAANGAPARRSTSPPRPTRCTGSRIRQARHPPACGTVATARMGGGAPPILTDCRQARLADAVARGRAEGDRRRLPYLLVAARCATIPQDAGVTEDRRCSRRIPSSPARSRT